MHLGYIVYRRKEKKLERCNFGHLIIKKKRNYIYTYTYIYIYMFLVYTLNMSQ